MSWILYETRGFEDLPWGSDHRSNPAAAWLLFAGHILSLRSSDASGTDMFVSLGVGVPAGFLELLARY
jgi:hypothetical protein